MDTRKLIACAAISLSLSACVVVPKPAEDDYARCEISSDRKTLRVMDMAKETKTYYSVSGILLTPILVPTSALISGAYVAVNNIYHLGEENIKCRGE